MNKKTVDTENQKLLKIWTDRSNLKPKFNDTKIVKGTSISTPFLAPSLFSPKHFKFKKDVCELLILGLNPSYSLGGWKGIFSALNPKALKKRSPQLNSLVKTANKNGIKQRHIDSYFKYNNHKASKKRYLNDIPDLEYTAFKKHVYFNKVRELAKVILEPKNSNWTHLDLYQYRKTNQNDLKTLASHPGNVCFFEKQLGVTNRIIEQLKPKIILVVNAYAGIVFRRMVHPIQPKFLSNISSKCLILKTVRLATDLTETQEKIIKKKGLIKLSKDQIEDCHLKDFHGQTFDKKIGAYKIKIGGKNQVSRVFFSGMLSGQRALDLSTFERLKWHVSAVKKGKTMK